MEKVIYENQSGKLIAKANGGVVELAQFHDGEAVGTVSMYFEEVKDLNNLISSISEEE
ncbi:hypothetical protein [Pseudobacillus wudalianchiensis]|uniref:hypothetical protein n=1 Tax=Pseudobacillus wudalianchiensis TaxID=1743143 RepID=UPI00159F15C8|nr:hypothetical protein [Bacillus wudalianchiensis]